MRESVIPSCTYYIYIYLIIYDFDELFSILNEINSDKEQMVQNTFEGKIVQKKIENSGEINEITRNIFKK